MFRQSHSQPQEQELIKRGYVMHIPPKRKRNGRKGVRTDQG